MVEANKKDSPGKTYKGEDLDNFDATKQARVEYSEHINSTEKDQMHTAYDKMGAETYEAAMISAGYPDPDEVVKVLLEKDFPKDSKIADVGCGTGLQAEILTEKGYTNLYGFDPSEELRKAAMEKGIYKECKSLWLDQKEGLPEEIKEAFDHLICVGTIFSRHVSNAGL